MLLETTFCTEAPICIARFAAKTKGWQERVLPSPLGSWPKPKGESTAAFLLSICGQNRRVKGAQPSFTSRFVAKPRGERSAARFVTKTEG